MKFYVLVVAETELAEPDTVAVVATIAEHLGVVCSVIIAVASGFATSYISALRRSFIIQKELQRICSRNSLVTIITTYISKAFCQKEQN